jgi:DNA ligase (NAD+)
MDIEQAKQEITTLREKLEYYAKKYYDDDKPEISDYEYDMMMNQLKKLEKQFPELITKDSLTQKVGGHVKEGFAQITHEVPLQSLQDVFSFEELIEFDLRVKKQLEVQDVNYVVETKIDGLSVALEYVNGEFIRGATRGNGLVGEDVTDNLKTIKNIPRKLKDNITITVRGEVFIGTAEFEKLNQEREVLRREFICECKKCGGWVTQTIGLKYYQKKTIRYFYF